MPLQSTVSLSTHAGPTPVLSAGNSTLFYYDPGTMMPTLKELAGITQEHENRLNPRCIAALRVVFTYCMRASEYLQLTENDVYSCDRVIVGGLKHSASYFIFLPGICKSLDASGFHPVHRSLSGCTYQQLYRACVRAGIAMRLTDHDNFVRTHFSRQCFIRSVANERTNKDLSGCLRHRSDDSITYYGAREEVSHGEVKGRNPGYGKRQGVRRRRRSVEE